MVRIPFAVLALAAFAAIPAFAGGGGGQAGLPETSCEAVAPAGYVEGLDAYGRAVAPAGDDPRLEVRVRGATQYEVPIDTNSGATLRLGIGFGELPRTGVGEDCSSVQ